MAKHETVRWGYWLGDYPRELPAAEPWQASALSVDIEPNGMTADRKDYSIGPFVSDMWDPEQKKNTLGEFERRLNLLSQYRTDPQYFTFRNDGKLYLHEFVVWMKAMGITDYPSELFKLDAKQHELAEFQKSQTELGASETRTYSHLAKPSGGNAAPVPIEAPVSTGPVDAKEKLNGPESGHGDFSSNHKPALENTLGRRHILNPAIEKAISSAGSCDNAAVYLQLKELAIGGEPPFTGVVDDGGALAYTNSNNKPDSLSRSALSKRLARRRGQPDKGR